MQDNIKNKVVVILFGIIIYGFFFLNLVTPDKKSSVSERRKLEQFPKLSLKAIIKGISLRNLIIIVWISFIKERSLEN